jgi:alkanesulfonate monooxygenase SsuD/methylene tetrahydromethanopterin reductase-like flavin-dependent oxidoreductase (luciferase family)
VAIEIGVSFDGFAPFPESVAVARAAAAAGAGSLWMAEHLGYREAILSCLAFALATDGPAVVPTAISPYVMHPVPTAMALATLAEAAPGRVRVAVGIGNPLFLQEAGVAPDRPVRAVREFVEALRALWTGEPVHQEGLLFRLAGARLAFRPPGPIPVYLAPMKAQMLRLAGRIGDGVTLSAGLSAAFVAHSLALAAEGARAAGRDPAGLRRSGYLFFLASRDERRAADTVRQKLAFVLRNRFLDESLAHSGLPVDQAAIIDAIGRRDLGGAARLVPDEAVEAFAVCGSPARCRERLEAYVAAGLDEPVVVLLGGPEDRALGLEVVAGLARDAGAGAQPPR